MRWLWGTFEIGKVAAPILGFTPISKKFGLSNTISKAAILGKITGNKTGYVLKSIVPSDNSFASVSAAFEMTILRAGNFTATITLSRENYEDAVIQNCSFKIALGDAPTDLRLTGFVRKFSDSRTITAAQILAKISGKKDGDVLKTITINSGNDVAKVSSNKKEITIQKAGTFTADIVLERANYKDATVPKVIFTIQKGTAAKLTFGELTKPFGETITAANILTNVKGSGKTGYTLKSIVITSGGDVATVSGNKPALQIVSKKVGTFKATLVLEKANYEDATITNAAFTITKKKAPTLTFKKLARYAGDSNIIKSAAILSQIPEKEKAGYTLKSLSVSDTKVAGIRGTKPNLEIVIKKAGKFTVDMVLEHPNYLDVALKGQFAYIFKALVKDYYGSAANSIVQTSDGGYIVAGYNKTSKDAKTDLWILKLNSLGIQEWDKTIGGSNRDEAHSVVQTSDGGYAVLGITQSKGAGKNDLWVLKLNASGVQIFEKTFGGIEDEYARSIIQTRDKGYAVLGTTKSKGLGGVDIWVLKLDGSLNKSWDITYGKGKSYDNPVDDGIIQTADGGYVVAALTDEDHSRLSVLFDILVLKLSSSGSVQWNHTIGRTGLDDRASSIIQTGDGNYVLLGDRYVNNHPNRGYAVKLENSSTKKVLWEKDWSATYKIMAKSAIQTSDGGYAVAGYSISVSDGNAKAFYMAKLDSSGNKSWQKEFPITVAQDQAQSIIQTSDGGYVLAGQSRKYKFSNTDSTTLMMIIKVDSSGNIVGE